MTTITIDDLKKLTNTEGLVLQGCGGDLQEWEDGVNKMFTEKQILRNGDIFKDVVTFKHGNAINLLFSMDNVDLDMSKLAMWRIATYSNFGGTWLSDYCNNQLGMAEDKSNI